MTHEPANFPDEPEVTHPLLSHVMERNIRTITRLRLQTAHERPCKSALPMPLRPFRVVWSLCTSISYGLGPGSS